MFTLEHARVYFYQNMYINKFQNLMTHKEFYTMCAR